MAASALTIVVGGLGHDQRDLHRIPQSDQTVAQFRFLIKGFDLVLQMAQLTDRARQPVAGTDQADIMPHDILNGLHIALDQCRIGIIDQSAFIPRRNILAGGNWKRFSI